MPMLPFYTRGFDLKGYESSSRSDSFPPNLDKMTKERPHEFPLGYTYFLVLQYTKSLHRVNYVIKFKPLPPHF